jgi:hypothetical protein
MQVGLNPGVHAALPAGQLADLEKTLVGLRLAPGLDYGLLGFAVGVLLVLGQFCPRIIEMKYGVSQLLNIELLRVNHDNALLSPAITSIRIHAELTR